ncbi:hypothetical protein AN958_07478 [Leucoagaricus sp. SymC.cos]|nr:hypothetical protein AN958_07478 [Leucoagaricus sp. SymC.cos]
MYRSQLPEKPFLPGFIAGSLYIALIQQTVVVPDKGKEGSQAPSICTPSYPPVRQIQYLAFFYQEKPTVPPLGPDVCVQGQYWFFEPSVLKLQQGFKAVHLALCWGDVLGYARVAENVRDSKLLNTLITYDDHKVSKSDLTSELYVFHAIGRLRKWEVVRSVLWDYEKFQNAVEKLREQWSVRQEPLTILDRARKSIWAGAPPRPFTEFPLCEFSTQGH